MGMTAMQQLTVDREELARHYDLAPSVEKAEAMGDILARMSRVMTPFDWAIHAPYVEAINRLKKERNAVILAHNYMTPQIYHGIADVVGDSLQLADRKLCGKQAWKKAIADHKSRMSAAA